MVSGPSPQPPSPEPAKETLQDSMTFSDWRALEMDPTPLEFLATLKHHLSAAIPFDFDSASSLLSQPMIDDPATRAEIAKISLEIIKQNISAEKDVFEVLLLIGDSLHDVEETLSLDTAVLDKLDMKQVREVLIAAVSKCKDMSFDPRFTEPERTRWFRGGQYALELVDELDSEFLKQVRLPRLGLL